MPGDAALNRLRLIAIIAPISFVALVGVLMDRGLEQVLSRTVAHLVAVGIISAGALVFALWVFALLKRSQERIDRQQNEAREQAETVARLEERERIGMGLHDEVIQSIYAIQLSLEDCQQRTQDAPEETCALLDQAIDDLGKVVATTRRYIFGLRPFLANAEDLPRALGDLLEEFRVNTTVSTQLTLDDVTASQLSDEQAALVLQTAQAGLESIRRSGSASAVVIDLACSGQAVALEMRGDGGLSDADRFGWLDETNRRVEAMGGSLKATNQDGEITISLRFPVAQRTTIDNEEAS